MLHRPIVAGRQCRPRNEPCSGQGFGRFVLFGDFSREGRPARPERPARNSRDDGPGSGRFLRIDRRNGVGLTCALATISPSSARSTSDRVRRSRAATPRPTASPVISPPFDYSSFSPVVRHLFRTTTALSRPRAHKRAPSTSIVLSTRTTFYLGMFDARAANHDAASTDQ